jgi:arsenate reductase (glutaredoxin)
MTLQVYGIPTCGTCKKALQWLQSHRIEHEFINTKEQPPSRVMLEQWVAALGNPALRNTSGQSYRALGEVRQTWTDADWVTAFAKDAMLIKRPVFVQADRPLLAGFRDDRLRAVLGL